jgi:hypothetical protein
MRNLLIGAALLAVSFVAQTGDAAAVTTSRVTYCESFSDVDDRRFLTLVSTSDGREILVANLTVNNMPVIGERHLVESPVVRRMPRVMHCMIRSVNGNSTMILTTRGGAEWHVTNPGIVR